MVIVLDRHKRPLEFMTERRCRIVMEKRRAILYRIFPAVIIMKDVDAGEIPDLPEYRINFALFCELPALKKAVETIGSSQRFTRLQEKL